MMENVETSEKILLLRKIQDVDRRILGLRRIQEAEPKRLKEADDLVAAEEARLKTLGDSHGQYQRDIGRKELDVKSRQEKIERLKGQLLKAATNKEYQALMNEISLEEVEKGRVEDQILEMMMGIEDFSREEKSLKDDMAVAKVKAAEIRKEVEAGLSEMQEREAVLLAERKEVAAKIDGETLRRYEGLFRSRRGEAMVQAIYQPGSGGEEARYVCQGCFMPLTHQMVNLLLLGQEIVACKSCGRLLYVEQPKDEE